MDTCPALCSHIKVVDYVLLLGLPILVVSETLQVSVVQIFLLISLLRKTRMEDSSRLNQYLISCEIKIRR